MQTFAEFRKRLVESGDRERIYPDDEPEAPVEPTTPRPTEASPAPVRSPMPDHLAADVERTIDTFIGQLRAQLTNPMTGPEAQRGIWDRMKNWWSNMWHGRYNQQNPYFWKNKLGDDLGRQASPLPQAESVQGMPLEHYKVLHEQAILLEQSLAPGAEGLQVVRIVDQWGRNFKQAIMNLIARHTGSEEGISDPTPPPSGPGSPMAAADEEEHEAPGHEEEEHEEPTAPKKPIVFDDLEESRSKLRDEVKAMKDRLPEAVYAKLMHHIEVGSDEHLNMVSTFLQGKRTAPMRDPGEVGRSSPAAAVEPIEEKPPVERVTPKREPAEDEDVRAPAPDKRQWKELSVNEREQWDQAGGGSAGDASFYARHHHDIRTMPWILRLGDPRLTAIESIPGRQLYKRLVRQKRVETPAHPIRSKLDLEKAVEEAKRLHGKEREDVSTDRKARHARRLSNAAATPGERTAPLPAPAEEEPPVEPTVEKLRPPRTAPLRTGGKVEDVPDADALRADLETIKDEIEPEVAENLSRWIEKGEPEFLVSARDKMKMLKEKIASTRKKDKPTKSDEDWGEEGSGGGDKLEKFESTIQDRTAFLVSNFRHVVNETNQAVSILGEKKKSRNKKKRV